MEKKKKVTFPPETNNQKKDKLCLTNTQYGCMTCDNQTPHTDTEVQGQNTSGFESIGEPASSPCRRGTVSERREQRSAECVNITAGRREELLAVGCWVANYHVRFF